MINPTGKNMSDLPMKSPLGKDLREKDDWEFYAEAIQSWRAWRVIDFGGVLVLESITYKTTWIPRQEVIAECRNRVTRTTAHAAPDLDHSCGIYSLKSMEHAARWSGLPKDKDNVVYGRVSIWGHCFKFVDGYLSEFAYPSLIYVPTQKPKEEGIDKDIDIDQEDLAIELSSTYRVEAIPV